METLKLIFGDANLSQWIYALLLALGGFMLFKLFTYNTRTDKASSFNPYYWWKDNRVEFIIGIILFYIMMRFHSDLVSLLSENFNFPLITNRYLFIFTGGLLFTMILKKGRSFFKIREDKYANGQKREHVGNRPDDR